MPFAVRHVVPALAEFQALPEVGIHLVYLPSRTLPRRVRVLIEFLVERFAAEPPWEGGWSRRRVRSPERPGRAAAR